MLGLFEVSNSMETLQMMEREMNVDADRVRSKGYAVEGIIELKNLICSITTKDVCFVLLCFNFIGPLLLLSEN